MNIYYISKVRLSCHVRGLDTQINNEWQSRGGIRGGIRGGFTPSQQTDFIQIRLIHFQQTFSTRIPARRTQKFMESHPWAHMCRVMTSDFWHAIFKYIWVPNNKQAASCAQLLNVGRRLTFAVIKLPGLADPQHYPRTQILGYSVPTLIYKFSPNADEKHSAETTLCQLYTAFDSIIEFIWVAVISAKNHKRQRRKRQSVTTKREKSQTPRS